MESKRDQMYGWSSPERHREDAPKLNAVDRIMSFQQEIQVHVRWMIRRDMPEVLAIEADGFEFPWLEEDFIRCLRQRNCIGMVAEHEDRVIGFMIHELNKTRIQVLNLATADDFKRRGVGSKMVGKLIEKLSTQRRTRVTLEVRETNLPAQLLFKSMDFRAVSVLREYYEDTPEDAYLMQYKYGRKVEEYEKEAALQRFINEHQDSNAFMARAKNFCLSLMRRAS